MKQRESSPRIVSVCVTGNHAKRAGQNAKRLIVMRTAASAISEAIDFDRLDAVVFPAGFFRLRRSLGHLPGPDRMRRLDASKIGRAAREACVLLEPRSPGVKLVVGVDSWAKVQWEVGDQFAVASDAAGTIGLARKIFPSIGDTVDAPRPTVPRLADYGAPERFIDLPSGHRAVLCACYDLLGLADHSPGSKRFNALQLLAIDQELRELGDDGFEDWREEALNTWETCLEMEAPRVALVAIHGFKRPGRECYWQRHGIAAASARLRGLVVGAAHFKSHLPEARRATLAAFKVRRKHLYEGIERKAHILTPEASLSLSCVGFDVLIRLFEGGPLRLR
jgi:hypothetical protein